MRAEKTSELGSVIVLVAGVCIAQSGVQAGTGSELIFEHAFDASVSFGQTVATFDVPTAGTFRVTTLNPDLSSDGYFGILLREGTTLRYQFEGMLFGFTATPAYHGVIVEGVESRLFEFSVHQSIADLGSLNFEVYYNLPNGTNNPGGTNTVRLEFLPQMITPAGAPILSISSDPMVLACEPPDGSVTFDAGDGARLIVRTTSFGNGVEGGHEIYVDGSGYGYTLCSVLTSTPEFYTVEVGAGLHEVQICHNDGFFPDNGNMPRDAEIYVDGGDDCSGFPCGNNDNKVLLCHVPPGNPGNAQTLCISPSAVAAHLENHEGDHCGPCGAGNPRFQDDAGTADTGNGVPRIVDMGDYELQPCPADVNGDGTINALDLIDLLPCLGQPAVSGCEAEDVNEDGTVNVLDLIELRLAAGTSCR
jgi:hypothetical protein